VRANQITPDLNTILTHWRHGLATNPKWNCSAGIARSWGRQMKLFLNELLLFSGVAASMLGIVLTAAQLLR
jgi:hypothetical protein